MNYNRIYNLIIERRLLNPLGRSEYTESHHIVPRSLGGSNDKSNIVKLSAREHFICHLLLVKIHKHSSANHKMVKAFIMMLTCKDDNQDRYISSHSYQRLREDFSAIQSYLQSGDRNSQFDSFWIVNPKTGENKKLIKSSIVPDDWVRGRGKSYTKRHCQQCKIEYFNSKSKFCSLLCRTEFNKRPRVFSEEHKQKLKETNWAFNDSEAQREHARHQGLRSKSEETKKKIQMAMLGHAKHKVICPHCYKEGAPNVMKRWHFDKCRSRGEVA